MDPVPYIDPVPNFGLVPYFEFIPDVDPVPYDVDLQPRAHSSRHKASGVSRPLVR
jgi:hypothetical protein